MLRPVRGLDARALSAVADLERRVVGADGGRLKLEWDTLRRRTGDRVDDLLWEQDGRVLGFLGLYDHGSPLEVAGMVDPAARRRGVGSALLDAGLALARDRGQARVLLVAPRGSAGAHCLAVRRGGALDHSEHALVLHGAPAGGRADPSLGLRRAGPADAPAVGRLLEAAFGHPADRVAEQLDERTLVAERDGVVVGTVRLTRDGDEAGVYGFAVDPEQQGRGIGRDVLRRVCRLLREEGAARVRLEVDVGNDRALGLYTSVGFRPVTTEDYYALLTP